MATILIVDDDPNTCQLYQSLLPPFGHQVLPAFDGREGLKLAQARKPNLIVSDILMPTMNGYEFVTALRKLPGLDHTHVIFQSASFLSHESRLLGESCGVREFLSKPCDPEQILGTVNRVLGLPAYQAGKMPAPPPPSSSGPVSMLLNAFYQKGKELDDVSVRLAVLVEFGIQISQLAAPDALLESALNAARKVIGANLAGAGILSQSGREFSYFRIAGLEPEAIAGIPNYEAATLHQIAAERSVMRAFSSYGKPCPLLLPKFHPAVQSFLGLPVRSADHTYGVIYIADKLGGGEFTKQDEHLLGTIAARLAIGYENVLREQRLKDQMVQLEREIAGRRQAEDRFRLLVETSPMGILLCDASGKITEANSQLQKMFGYAREELVGSTVEMLVPEPLRTTHMDHRSRYVAAPQSRPMGLGIELHGRRKDGTTFPVEVSLGPLTGTDQPMISSTIVDITERKKLQDQLRVSQRLEAVGQLAAGIAHDFNNILTAITGNTKLALADLPADSPAQQSLAEIEKGSLRATKLVRQILSFSRQEPLKTQVTNLCEVVEEALRLLRAGLRSEIEILSHFKDQLPHVAADSTQIHQIIMNLGTNAADAMKEGGVLEVRLERSNVDAECALAHSVLSPGNYICLSVRDSGCGMDKGTMERIFEPFFTTKPQGEGTGLGLSVVHGIVKNHGGAITVDSEPGKGTVFHVYFPTVQPTAVSEIGPPQLRGEIRGQGQSVLYVDDEESLVFLMTRMLRRLGYQVTGFSDPKQALAAFRSRPQDFDVVVTDLSMPGMTGIEMARELLQVRPGMPILIASGYIRPADNELVRSLGLPDLIHKPNTVEQLGNVLQAVFEKLKTQQGAHGVQKTQSQNRQQAASAKA